MRLFAGIAIDPAVLNNLEQALRDMRPVAPLNWSPLENLHITSKFIGPWPEQRLDELKHALGEIQPPAPFGITIEGLGYFPNPHRPKVLFAGVKTGAELAGLARHIEEKVTTLGVEPETRPYTAHLTLAKIKEGPAGALRERIAHMKNFVFGTFQVSEFYLYLSTPVPGGSQYNILATYPLGLAA